MDNIFFDNMGIMQDNKYEITSLVGACPVYEWTLLSSHLRDLVTEGCK